VLGAEKRAGEELSGRRLCARVVRYTGWARGEGAQPVNIEAVSQVAYLLVLIPHYDNPIPRQPGSSHPLSGMRGLRASVV